MRKVSPCTAAMQMQYAGAITCHGSGSAPVFICFQVSRNRASFSSLLAASASRSVLPANVPSSRRSPCCCLLCSSSASLKNLLPLSPAAVPCKLRHACKLRTHNVWPDMMMMHTGLAVGSLTCAHLPDCAQRTSESFEALTRMRACHVTCHMKGCKLGSNVLFRGSSARYQTRVIVARTHQAQTLWWPHPPS